MATHTFGWLTVGFGGFITPPGMETAPTKPCAVSVLQRGIVETLEAFIKQQQAS